MIDSESQTVLNTLKEHDFQDAFKKVTETQGTVVGAEGDYFRGDGGQ
jgi:hypothetical protein